MDTLTARQKFILNNLIEKGSISIGDLSQQIDVSFRTILREISTINKSLKHYKLRISYTDGNLNISGGKANMDKLRDILNGIPYLWLLTPEQRVVFITAQLLLSNNPIKSAYFSYQFNVVEGTISVYLDKVESWMKVRNLDLVRKRGLGLKVEGNDWNKGNAFVELLYSYKSMNDLLPFLYKDTSEYSVLAFFKVSFGEKLVNQVRELVKKLEGSSILKSSDEAYFAAFVHILLSVKRTRSGSSIELPDYLVSDILSSKKFSFIKEIDEIFRESGVALPENELAYLAIHLNGGKYLYKYNRKFEDIGIDLEDLAKEVVYEVSKRLNIRINIDKQLIVGLVQHFNPAFYRLTMGLQVRNPIVNEIKEYYMQLFEAVDYACRIVFSKYNLSIPSSEVGYITMHIGAAIERQNISCGKLRVLIICSNGIGTANILYSKLKMSFPEFGEMDVCSLKDMNEKINRGYDIVLSTITVGGNSNKDIITVSPFLPNKDIEKIRGIIKSKISKSGIDRIVEHSNIGDVEESAEDFKTADDMLKDFRLEYLNARDFQSVVKEIVSDIYELNLIDDKEKVKYLIKKREEQGSVVIPGEHVALIHIRSEEVESPFLGAYRLKDPVKMKSLGFSSEDVDTFLVMFARKDESNYILELLGKISMSLVEGKKFVKLLRIGNVRDIRTELVRILNREDY